MEGRVEICVNDTWTSICNNLWTTNDGNVACRQLGFSQISKHLSHTHLVSCVTHNKHVQMLSLTLMADLELVLDWSTLEAGSALAVRQGLLTVHKVQQQVAVNSQQQDLPVLRVSTSVVKSIQSIVIIIT